MDWKKNLDPVIKDYLNDLLKKVLEEKKAYSQARDVSKAQIWVALALLYREISLIKSEIEEIKSSLREKSGSKKIEKALKKF